MQFTLVSRLRETSNFPLFTVHAFRINEELKKNRLKKLGNVKNHKETNSNKEIGEIFFFCIFQYLLYNTHCIIFISLPFLKNIFVI